MNITQYYSLSPVLLSFKGKPVFCSQRGEEAQLAWWTKPPAEGELCLAKYMIRRY
jgi:hypothetical protein